MTSYWTRFTRPAAVAAAAAILAGCGVGAQPSSGSRVPPRTSIGPSVALPWKSQHKNPYLSDDVLIADSHNNRILLVTPGKRIVWQFPAPGQPTPLYDDDDVFFGPHFDEIITNEEDNNTLAIIKFNSKKVVWKYGHSGVAGSAPGYLDTPDDAFLYDHHGHYQVTVADIKNQRILFIDRNTQRILKQYGETGVQVVNPPTTYGAPNGDFPAPNGGMLVTQINGDNALLLNRAGQIVWTLNFPRAFPGFPSGMYPYPSDANFTPHGNVIVAFYDHPGAVVKMSPTTGKILWEYAPTSGSGELNRPSLAVELPNGMVLLNDDYNHRVIVIDPKTNQIVWQYGHTGVAGSQPGYLNIPDGADVLPPGVVPGGKNPIAGHLWSYPGTAY